MKIVVPLGGIGKRFENCGYTRPKPLVRILGKEIVFWLLDSLNIKDEDEVYIPYNESLEKYNFSRLISLKHPRIKVLPIANTRGASETVKLCVDHFGIKGRLCVLDGDTWYEEDIVDKIRNNPGNLVACFHSTTPDPIYSYVLEDGEEIREIREKKKISDLACSGCYVFEEAQEFSKTVASMDLNKSGETYTSQAIAKMMSEGKKFRTIKAEKFHVLGTPEQAIAFSKSHEEEKKRFCFDLDNTLVTAPRTPGDYSTVEPIQETINYLKRLKSRGHTIIIYTARRMRTHSGNISAVVADVGRITMETLERFAIPYDELCFGKPYAHFYIDDLMVDPHSDMNKELGLYMEDVTPRHFNKVEKGRTFRKSSSNKKKLEGEAFYHRWVEEKCEEDVKAMFPKIIAYEEGVLETELVQGLNFSTLYLNQILKKDSLTDLLNHLERLHSIKETGEKRFSYDSLGPKFSERLSMYDHTKYGLSLELACDIRKRLDNIAAEGFTNVMIHGDPVFSNILLNDEGKIKMVDMRGLEKDKLTVFGHHLYDMSKVYQSLCGYDEILLDKRVVPSYKRLMKETFNEKFDKKTMDKIKVITASLFFSLIPLHNDNLKFQSYVDVALSIL